MVLHTHDFLCDSQAYFSTVTISMAKLCIRSFRLSFSRSVSRITHDRSIGSRPNMVRRQAQARGDPLEVINFLWCRSGLRIRIWILDYFSIFFTIAEQGILGEFLPFGPWRSLRSLSVLVVYVIDFVFQQFSLHYVLILARKTSFINLSAYSVRSSVS